MIDTSRWPSLALLKKFVNKIYISGGHVTVQLNKTCTDEERIKVRGVLQGLPAVFCKDVEFGKGGGYYLYKCTPGSNGKEALCNVLLAMRNLADVTEGKPAYTIDTNHPEGITYKSAVYGDRQAMITAPFNRELLRQANEDATLANQTAALNNSTLSTQVENDQLASTLAASKAVKWVVAAVAAVIVIGIITVSVKLTKKGK